jgi:meso-butanediol dehydrogenase/(S,S)-butanediol dehydrogenase/diacetyl reductase
VESAGLSQAQEEEIMENLHRFEGKVVVITGASRGIGEGIALRFAREGADLVVAANEDRVNEVAQKIKDLGRKALPMVVDVTDKAQVEGLYAKTVETFGKVDVSVQNAGVITIKTVDELTEQEWDFVMDVNTKGVFLCCQAAARQMIKQGYGKLINTGSGQSRDGFIYTPHYAASKFGVIGITQSLAKELAPFGITVNAFCPGIIATDMWKYNDKAWGALLGDYEEGELITEWVENKIPMKRAGTPDDVAGLVAFLASKDADYLTGQTINIDGGLIMS